MGFTAAVNPELFGGFRVTELIKYIKEYYREKTNCARCHLAIYLYTLGSCR